MSRRLRAGRPKREARKPKVRVGGDWCAGGGKKMGEDTRDDPRYSSEDDEGIRAEKVRCPVCNRRLRLRTITSGACRDLMVSIPPHKRRK